MFLNFECYYYSLSYPQNSLDYMKTIGIAYPVKDVRPALKGDALKDCEHGEGKVVEVGDAVVGTLPELLRRMPQYFLLHKRRAWI
jgi:hypothetical protein